MTIDYRRLDDKVLQVIARPIDIYPSHITKVEIILREELGGMRAVPDWWPAKCGVPGPDDYEAKIEHDRDRIAELEHELATARARLHGHDMDTCMERLRECGPWVRLDDATIERFATDILPTGHRDHPQSTNHLAWLRICERLRDLRDGKLGGGHE